VFQDLDATLKAMMGDPAAPVDVRNAEVSFDTPGKDFTPTQATLNLFLLEVQENRTLRDDAPMRELIGDVVISHRPPLRVDCGYLVTAWSAQHGNLKAAEEHRLLGLALLWLSRFPRVEDRFLQASLQNPAQPYPLPMTVAQSREGENLGHFWSALGIAPRSTFSLTVTISLQPVIETDEFPRVKAVVLEPALLSAPALAGRILDETLAPVPQARVTVQPGGAQVTVGINGRFAFTDLPFGNYTLHVQTPNHPDVQDPVQYQPDSQVHNVIVSSP
jgi:hypothetical protein